MTVDSPLPKIIALENEALARQAAGDLEAAYWTHGKALFLAQGLKRPRLAAVLFNRSGQILEAQGEVQQAVIAYESGLKALNQDPALGLESLIRSLYTATKTYSPVDEWRSGRLEVPDLYSETGARDLQAAQEDPFLVVRLLINAGNAYLRQAQDGPALNDYRQALARPEIAGAPELQAHALVNAGHILRRRGELDQAESYLNEALELLRAHAGPLEQRQALLLLAGIAHLRGQIQSAIDSYTQALDLYLQAGDTRGEGRARAGLAHVSLEQGNFADALLQFQRAVALAEAVGDQDTLWHALWGLGSAQQAAGDLEPAAASLQRSLDLILQRHEGLRTDEGKVAFLDSVQTVFDQLITLHLDRAARTPDAYAEALETAEIARGRALEDLIASRRDWSDYRGYDYRPSRSQPFSEQAGLGEPSSSLDFDPAIQMAPGIPTGSPEPGEAEMPPMAQMAQGVSSGLSKARKRLRRLGLVELASELARASQSSSHEFFSEAAAGISSPPQEPERQAFPPDAPQPRPIARLVYYVLEERTAVFAVTLQGEVSGHVIPLGHQALAGRVRDLRAVLGVAGPPTRPAPAAAEAGPVIRAPSLVREASPIHEDDSAATAGDPTPLLQSLYAELVGPLALALPQDGTPIAIEPHGPLWLLPFAALQSPAGDWLADRWPLLYAPSAQSLDEIRRRPDYGGPNDLLALVAGNPQMPDVKLKDGLQIRLQPLPGAEREARLVAGQFPEERRTLLVGSQADWAEVVALMPVHGILHLSTHGVAYDADPLASFIALGKPPAEALQAVRERLEKYLYTLDESPAARALLEDGANGLLTARQVLDLPLAADLVALSACQTGLGQITGDGMIGLSRAFLVAGARAVLVSQWSVDDQATAELMAAFYQGYIQSDNKALALQRAMQVVRKDPRYAHPRQWAGFMVVGAEA